MSHEGTCRFCKKYGSRAVVPYGTRHYACPPCLVARKREVLATLPPWILNIHRVLIDAYLADQGAAGLDRFDDEDFLRVPYFAMKDAGILEVTTPRFEAIKRDRPDLIERVSGRLPAGTP
jgi:hypothetical protein